MVAVGYPSAKIQMGQVKHPLAAYPFMSEPLYVTPEMTGVSEMAGIPSYWASKANIAMDGQMTMNTRSQFQFYTRSLLQVASTLLRQLSLPPEYRLSLDAERFLSSMTLEKDGEIVTGGNWMLAPGPDVHNPITERHRQVEACVRQSLYEHYARGIPSAPATIRNIDRPVIHRRGRPRKGVYHVILSYIFSYTM